MIQLSIGANGNASHCCCCRCCCLLMLMLLLPMLRLKLICCKRVAVSALRVAEVDAEASNINTHRLLLSRLPKRLSARDKGGAGNNNRPPGHLTWNSRGHAESN